MCNFHQQKSTSCQYPKVIEFSLYCTCSLHVNVVKDISATLLVDSADQVRNKSLGAVALVLPLFATPLVVVVGSTGQDKRNYKVLLPGSNETNPIFEHNRDICGYRSYLYRISPIEKCFKDTGTGYFFSLQRQWQVCPQQSADRWHGLGDSK